MAYTNADDTISLESLVGPMMLDCPYPIAEQALRWAAIEICERTRCYANTQTKNVSSGSKSIILAPADDGLVSDIQEVRWNGKEIDPLTREEADNRTLTNPMGVPSGYYRPNPEVITLASPPASDGVLKLVLILTPTRTATSIPRFLYDLHGDAIEHGAKARLLLIPNRPWTNGELAAYHKQEFEKMVGTLSIKADKDGTRRPLRVKTAF